MKTPEEIKKGLGCQHDKEVPCSECSYNISWCRAETAKDGLELIQQLEAQVPKWISVKERLPEQHLQTYLCWWVFGDGHSGNGFETVSTWYSHGSNGYVNGPHFVNEGYCGMHVTHWMPLPEGPKDDGHA